MDCGDYTLQKIQLLLNQISQLRESEFPHSDSREALELLERLFENDNRRIKYGVETKNADLRDQSCAEANYHIARFLPILGFILRSTNTRNAFEFFVPLLQLAQKLLKKESVKVILSSEWQFSPFTYPLVFAELPEFVLIGLPASESENPLIIPLTGHELGHSVWKVYGLASVFSPLLEVGIINKIKQTWKDFERHFSTSAQPSNLSTDLSLRAIWSRAHQNGLRQLEEVFCDCIGVRLFGESYCYAIEYLLSPHYKNRRSEIYPDIGTRTRAMVEAGRQYNVRIPEDLEDKFKEHPLDADAKQNYLLKITDCAVSGCINDAISRAGDIVTKAGFTLPESSEISRIQKCFAAGKPACSLKNLADIINAGWKEYLGIGEEDQNTARGQRLESLADLILKTIEVMEYEIRTSGR